MVFAAIFFSLMLGMFLGGVVTQRIYEQLHSEQLKKGLRYISYWQDSAEAWHFAYQNRLSFHPDAERIRIFR